MIEEEGPGFKPHEDAGEVDSGPVGHVPDAGPAEYPDGGDPDAPDWADAEPPWDDGGEWDGAPWEDGGWDGAPWEDGGWDAPWEDGGWDAPWEDGGQPWDGGPWDGGDWDSAPWDDGGSPVDASPIWPDAQPPIVMPTGCDPSNAAGGIDAWLAFDAESASGTHIFVIRPNGCDVRQLTFGTSVDREPAFSPDGTYLSFSSDRGGTTQIWRMELATGTLLALTKSPTNARHSAWSPDGTLLTFATDDGGIWTMSNDGSNASHIAQAGTSCCTEYRAPTFSTDGTQILFDRYNEIDAIHLDGTAKRYVVSNWTTQEANPEMAPNGLRVAYDVYCGAGIAIFVAPYSGLPGDPCSGARITPDTFGPSANPAWGPSSLFAFERTSSGRLAIIDSTTGAAWEILDQPSLQSNPTWAPAGWQPH